MAGIGVGGVGSGVDVAAIVGIGVEVGEWIGVERSAQKAVSVLGDLPEGAWLGFWAVDTGNSDEGAWGAEVVDGLENNQTDKRESVITALTNVAMKRRMNQVGRGDFGLRLMQLTKARRA